MNRKWNVHRMHSMYCRYSFCKILAVAIERKRFLCCCVDSLTNRKVIKKTSCVVKTMNINVFDNKMLINGTCNKKIRHAHM